MSKGIWFNFYPVWGVITLQNLIAFLWTNLLRFLLYIEMLRIVIIYVDITDLILIFFLVDKNIFFLFRSLT